MIPTAVFTDEEHEAWRALEVKQLEALAFRKGGLGLPAVKAAPVDDQVILYRMEAKERTTTGGIIIPTESHDLEVDLEHPMARFGHEPKKTVVHQKLISVGLILDAGCAARDWMRSHGVLVGDIVKFAKYGGEEQNFHWIAMLDDGEIGAFDLKDFLQLNHRDIQDSLDLWHRLNGPEPTMEIRYVADDAGNGLHIVKPIVKEKGNV